MDLVPVPAFVNCFPSPTVTDAQMITPKSVGHKCMQPIQPEQLAEELGIEGQKWKLQL
jgi:hypothetical protein